MRNIIIPSIIASNQKELEERINKVKTSSPWLQLDIMDGKLVPTKSFRFNFKIPKTKCKLEAHLMIKDPIKWIKKHHKGINTIVFHIESKNNPEKVIKLIKSKRKNAGLAVNPKTPISKIKGYIDKVDMILIMTVNPGYYGAKFIPNTLKKVKELRKLRPNLEIEVDGSVNYKTIKRSSKAGANRFVVGSYLQKSKRTRDAIRLLKSKL